MYYECKENSKQCKLSELEWNNASSDEFVPISKIICEHSCQSNKAYGPDIGIIFNCQNMCHTEKTNPVEPDKPLYPVIPDVPTKDKKDKLSNIKLACQNILIIALMLIFI